MDLISYLKPLRIQIGAAVVKVCDLAQPALTACYSASPWGALQTRAGRFSGKQQNKVGSDSKR